VVQEREEERTEELCVICGEAVDLLDASAHAQVKGRTFCRECARKLGGAYNPDQETWTRLPRVPEGLEPRED